METVEGIIFENAVDDEVPFPAEDVRAFQVQSAEDARRQNGDHHQKGIAANPKPEKHQLFQFEKEPKEVKDSLLRRLLHSVEQRGFERLLGATGCHGHGRSEGGSTRITAR